MIERRTLEDVLNDLKEAENEYKEKCLKYGITEKVKRKKVTEKENLETNENEQSEEAVPEEASIENVFEEETEISEN